MFSSGRRPRARPQRLPETTMYRSKLITVILMGMFFLGAGPLLTACNTIEGVGEDLSASARTVKEGVFQ